MAQHHAPYYEPRDPQTPLPPLSTGDVAHLMTVLPGPWKPIVTLALETSLRLSVLRAQTWRDVNLERKTLHVTYPKNGTVRAILLTSTAVAVLAALPKDGPLLFPTLPRTLATLLRTTGQQAGFRDITWHRLRETSLARARRQPMS